MKKSIFKLLLATSMILASSAVYAGTLSPGTQYSIGSATKTSFKTSPKVTVLLDLTAGAAAATTWQGNAYHASAINKSIGRMYGLTSDDPGTYWKATPATAPSAVDNPASGGTAASGWTQEQ